MNQHVESIDAADAGRMIPFIGRQSLGKKVKGERKVYKISDHPSNYKIIMG